MIRIAILASAIALAAPALAQETQRPPANPGAPQALPPPDPTQPPLQDSPTQPTPQTAPPTASDVARIVEADFPTFDKDSNGTLSQAEFSDWLRKLRAASPDQVAPMNEADLKVWTASAFVQADTDKNQSVSKDEMTAFVLRPR